MPVSREKECFFASTEQQREDQSARTCRCGMTGCVPSQELLASQVSHDVRDVVIVGEEGAQLCHVQVTQTR
jgi:hypothetical protein